MLRAIYVDDERYNHILMEKNIKKRDDITLLGSYENAEQALEACKVLNPDVAFIDIQMPEMDGMELAAVLKQNMENLDVVFVTAYGEYAIEAFRVNATDYLVKPVDETELARVIEKIKKLRRLDADEKTMIIALGGFGILRNNKVENIVWPAQKVKELFAFLLLKRKGFVDKWVLCELLWPEVEGEKASANLYTAIYRLKNVLKKSEIPAEVVNRNSGYRLELSQCSVDFELFQEGVLRLLSAAEPDEDSLMRLEEIYRGDLFGSEGYLWAFEQREMLKKKYLSLLYKLGECEEKSNPRKSIEFYQRIVAEFPYEENAAFKIANLFADMGKTEELKKYYAYYENLLKIQMDDIPSEEVKEAFNRAIKK